MPERPRFFQRPVVVVVLVAVCAAVVYLPAIKGDWIYDDRPLISLNPYVHSFHWFGRWFSTDFWDVNEELVRFGGRMIYWRPLVTTSYGVDWQLGGGAPLFFHVMNTLWQAAVGGLAFVVLRRWIGALWPAALAAILFAIHPTKAESVAWIAGRTDVMCMVFVLLASEGIGRRLRGARGGLALEIVATVLAYMCKEQAIVLCAFAAIEGWVALDRPALDLRAVKRIVIVALPQAGIALGYLIVRAIVMPISAAAISKPLGVVGHTEAILETMGRFVALTFAPHDLSIQQALAYSRHGVWLFSIPYVVLGAVSMVVLVALAVLARRRWPVVTMGIGFYLFTLIPTSNVKYTEMATLVSERFLYLPVFGIALIVGAALAKAPGAWVKRGYALAVAVALALGMVALSRAADFANEREFWARELRLHWNSREAHNALIGFQVEDKHFASALQLLQSLKQVQDQYDRRGSWDLSIAYLSAHVLRYLVPDHDRASLQAIDTFCKDLVEHTKPATELATHGVDVHVRMTDSAYVRQLRVYRAQLIALRADVNSRLGNDEAAMKLANDARDVCQKCVTVVVLDAIVYARAGHYDEASAILDAVAAQVQERPIAGVRAMIAKADAARDAGAGLTGPAKLQARASELAALELWGRAYDVLAPYAEEIKHAPRFAQGFAELAFRAGESGVARDVLAGSMPPAEVDAQFEQWSRNMGWSQ